MTANFRRFVALLPVVFASAPALATSASDFCAIYPIAVPQQVLVDKQVGDLVTGLPRGTGAGNFSWLTWRGANDAPTLAKSLLPPGNSDVYVNPDNAADHRLDLGDWTQGTPGSMNAKAVRDNLDALLRQDIIVPAWDNLRGQGSGLDYRVQRFVTIRLRDYRLTGQGWLSFEYRGEAICYNQPPTAAPQTLNTDEDIALPITLTGSDPDGDTLGFHIVSPPGHGRLSGDAPQVVYTPDADYHGSDSFSFRVNDGRIDSSPATVAIIVKPVNDAPGADPQTRATDEDTPLPITLTGRDSDGDALGFTVIEAPRHGELSGSGADLVYTPTANFNGEDSFRFKSNDGVLDSTPAVIAITVNPVNDAPTAAPQSLETEEQQPLPITLSGNDSDGDALSYRIVTQPAHGTLSGEASELIYTGEAGFIGDDSFEFSTSDGALDSATAKVIISVIRINRPPAITSVPVETVFEEAEYAYQVIATDPDQDVLAYQMDRSPVALSVDTAGGLIKGKLDADYVQSVRNFNSQCYVVPEDVKQDGNGNVFVAPLFQRVRSAISKASRFVAPQTLTWHKTNTCLGCHVQTQAVLGLQASLKKAEIDEAAAEFLLSELLNSQQPDGSIRRSHPEHSGNQTSFALWALSHTEDRPRTLAARAAGLRFMLGRRIESDIFTTWRADHASGWMWEGTSVTAVMALAITRFLEDVEADPIAAANHAQLITDLQHQVPRVTEAFLYSANREDTETLFPAFRLLALTELRRNLSDASLIERTDTAIAFIDHLLRSRQAVDGGWSRLLNGSQSDPLTSAWVGMALNGLNPPLSDTAVRRTIEYLLDSQQPDGTWHTNSGLFTQSHLGTTGLVMAYLPVALEHLGNADLALGHLRLEQQGEQSAVVVEVLNRGLADVKVTSTLRLYSGRRPSGIELAHASVEALRSGETRWVSIPLAQSPTTDLYAEITADAALDECLDGNNTTSAGLTIVRATDPRGLFDTQTFLVNVEDSNAAPTIVSEPVTRLEQGKPYTYRVLVSDQDVGDAHEFSLVTAPDGLFISPLTGQFGYVLAELRPGSHPVTVRVTDLRGAKVEQTFVLIVTANREPVITSQPDTSASIGREYHYAITAVDEDGDTLRFRLDGAPLSMAINPETGEINWTPVPLHIGNQPVAVVVEDGRGGSDRQAFVIAVGEAPVNRAPEIVSAPPSSVEEGATYRYDVDALDPDADVLGYSSPTGPATRNIDAQSGLVQWAASDALISAVRARNSSCRVPAQVGQLDPELKWHWDGSGIEPLYKQVMMAPIVVQLTDDNGDLRIDHLDTPDVAFVSFANAGAGGDGILRAVDGATGREILAVTDPAARFANWAGLAAADLDGDGVVELVGTRPAGGLVAINRRGDIKWTSPHPASGWNFGAPSIADLDGDGSPEVVFGNTVLSADGTLKWTGSGAFTPLSVAADIIENESGLEVVAGPSLYSANGRLLWAYSGIGDGFSAIADLDGDGQPEVVVVGNSRLVALRANGDVFWGPVAVPDGGLGGPATIADLDGDGAPEIGIASGGAYYAFDNHGLLKWSRPIRDGSSQLTGSTSFDFDSDGVAEIVQQDEFLLRVLDGRNGEVRWEEPNPSGTVIEYPLVVDADQDGSADIVVASNNYFRPGVTGVRMFSSASRAWAPTRSIWNQHAYSIDNINDDGTVPRQPVKSWLTHNTFRLNTFPDRHPLGLADLALFDLRLDESDGTSVKVRVVNRGLAPTGGATSVRIFNGDPDAGGALIGTLDVPVLAVGEELTLSLDGLSADAISTDLYARIDESNTVVECLDDNNHTAAAYFEVRAADAGGLYDSQRFTVTVNNVNESPSIETTQLPTAAVAADYRYSIRASDPDLGDGLRFELLNPPSGLQIEAVSGELRWNPLASQAGTHTITVRVSDLGGLIAERSFELAVTENNLPAITSTAVLTAVVDRHYGYQVTASDADGDALSFHLDGAPAGMDINAETGEISWAPASADVGNQPVAVVVEDGRGGSDRQAFVIAVGEAPVNHAPEIVSAPPSSVEEGATYRYDVDAVDPDSDRLMYGVPVFSSPSSINADSGVLAWSVDRVLTSSMRGDNLSCRMPARIGTFNPVVKWHWKRPNDASTDENVFGPVVVGQLTDDNGDGRIDGDDTPDAVFVSQNRDTLTKTTLSIVNGANGTVHRQLSDSKLSGYGSLALADLDGDGVVEIVGVSMGSPTQLVAYHHDLTVFWSAQTESRANWPEGMMDAVTIADLDSDGTPEVVHGRRVYSADGTLLWQGAGDSGGQINYGYVPIVADVTGDGNLEVVAGRTVYQRDGSILWHAASIPADGFTAVGNFDDDSFPEIVLVSGGVIYLLDDGGVVRWSRSIPGGGIGGPPTIADFDADGRPEIGVAGLANYVVLEDDGSIKWQQPTQDRSSNRTGSSAFDFDSDGRIEVVYADEADLFVYDGDSGDIRMRVPVGSGTTLEYPVIVDVDGNGSAEIVVGSNHWPSARFGVTVFTSADDSWAPTRSIWNQHAYSIDNINDDGTVPRVPVKSWLTHNTFRLNTFPDRHPLGMADLALFDLRLDESDGTAVKLLVVNRGLAPTSATTTLHVFNGDPEAGGQLLGTLDVPVLAAGEERTLTLSGLQANTINSDLYARIDEGNAVTECLDDNNQTAAAYFEVHATDPGGLYGSQRFTVTVENVNEAPTILSAALPPATINQSYRFTVAAHDPDLGDGLRFELVAAPSGLQIESVSGELRWNPLASQAGTHAVTVRATDLAGLSAERSLTLTVSTNLPPEFTSTPVTAISAGSDYRYAVSAHDADGDPISFSLSLAPEGMRIDAVSGVIAWTPLADAVGAIEVEIRVEDNRGGFALQRYTLEVNAPENQVPVITSTPIISGVTGQAYRYAVDASDADGDVLSIMLKQAPTGMTLNEFSGELSWTPASSQVGTHAVRIEVSDGRGGIATQSFTVVVTAPADNNAPTITSTPTLIIDLGRAYTYAVIASDADGDTLSYRLTSAPSGMAIDTSTGALAWTPLPAQVGAHDIVIEVADGRGGIATQSFTVVVTAPANNNAPTITSTPTHHGKVDHAYTYAAVGVDADGDAIVWSLTTAPAGMTVDPASGQVQWMPTAPGDYAVTLRAADAGGYSDQSWTITVVAADVALSGALTVTPQPLEPGATMTITLLVEGAAGPVTVTATLDGQTIAIADAGTTTLVAPDAPGTHTLVVVISDGIDSVTVTQPFTVRDPADGSAPVVTLVLPAEHPDYDAVEVTAPTPVTGFVTGSDVTQWLLGVRASGESATRLLAQGVGEFSEREIARFDPTQLHNGLYTLILQAQDGSGNVASDSRMVRVTDAMKLGHYSISFEDVSIPVAGIPVTVTRTYDTRRAHESLDFGYGWTVDYRNVVLQESRRPGYAWTVLNQGGTFGQTCIRPMGDPIVMVRLPGGETASFKAKALPECRSVFDGDAHVQLVFEAVDGNDYTLEQTDYGILRWANVQGSPVPVLFDESSGSTEPADPQHYKLTTPEGLVYELDQGFGIRQVTEPTTGATLTYSSTGVKHSSGVGIDFIRDGQGRITMMKLPDGKVIEYGYSAPGDLDIVLDAGKEITSFGYAPQWPHYLQDIVDPRGVRVARNEYDDDGRLVAIIDADGHRTEYTHAIADRTERVKDRNGHVTTYVYDDRGRVLFETNALGETIARTYDSEGNTLSQTDALGRTTTWTYDVRGNRLTETNAAGETTTSSYNNKNQLLSQTDSSGQVVIRNDYDSRTGTLLTGTTDALGHVTGFGYIGGTGLFGTGQLGGITDALGASTAFTYSFEGYKASETDALGNVTAFAYDATGRVTSESRTRTVNGQQQTLTTTYRYDGKGRLLETTHPDGSMTTAEYAGLDQPVKACDALNRCTVTEYDARGQVLKLTAPDGTTQSKQYDGNGNVIAETDGNGQTTRFVYDAANRLVETIFADGTPATDADNPRSRSVYDAAGQLVESIDENGHSTRYVYDSAGRRTQVLLPAVAGETAGITTEYDASGRRRASVDATGAVTTYGYDAAGRLLETVFADGSAVRTGYDAVGRKVTDSDEMGRITRYGYDALGRLVTVVLPNPATGANPPLVAGDSPDSGTLVTRYQYDEAGNKTAQIDAEGRITRWEYDVLGREIARTLPDGQRETKAYDAAGQLIASTDFNGQTTGYDYDANGRLLRLDYPHDADVSYAYDGNGQRVRVIDGRGISTRAYDARGRLVAVNDATGGQLEYEYDPTGNLLARISPSQSLVYGFDARNRITAVTRSVDGEAPSTTAYGYDAAGNRTAMTGGEGVQSTYRYDRRHRLSSLVKRTAAGLLLAGMNYSVDASGLRTAVEESDAAGITRTVDYQYDAAKRLTSEVIGHRDAGQDRVSQWTYDRVGNRLTQTVAAGNAAARTTTYGYDGNDRLLSESDGDQSTTYQYDDNGNTLSKSGAAAVSYRYDDANRLIEAHTSDATITYAYDADGLRTTQTVTPNNGSETTTHYLQDPAYAYAQVVEEWTQEGGNPKRLSATYTFADELVSQTRYDAQGTPTTSYVQADGFGSTRWVTDAAGNVTDSVDYDAFGNTIHRTGSTGVEHLYRGERFDDSIAAYDLRARLYSPGNGRFLTQDTFAGFASDPQSLHKYLYANADPVNGRDPSGHTNLTELELGQSLNATLQSAVRIGTFAINAYDKVDRALTFIELSRGIAAGIQDLGTFVRQSVGDVREAGFIEAMRNTDEAARVLSSNFAWVLSQMATPKKEGQIGEFLKNPKNKLLIYGPTPYSRLTPWLPPGTRIHVGKMRLSKGSRDIELELGRASGQGGRMVGVGHSFANQKNQGSQWFRMDWHPPHGAGSNDRIDGNYHFHTQTAP